MNTYKAEPSRALAEKVGCLIPSDLRELAGITEGTEETWTKRGIGPPSVLFGNQRLYPIGMLAEWLHSQAAARKEKLQSRGSGQL